MRDFIEENEFKNTINTISSSNDLSIIGDVKYLLYI